MHLFATTPSALEPVLERELRDCGARSVRRSRGGVAFRGDLETAYRACLWSRTANRVLLRLDAFEVADDGALYEGVRSIDWSEHIDPDRTLAVVVAGKHRHISHTRYAALRVKDAIVDQMRERHGRRPSVDRARPDVLVHLFLDGLNATISIDLSGRSLHRRGYRAEGTAAPLKENLAAGLVLLAGWDGDRAKEVPFVDPMCGSGTLAIEAALIATDTAPGLLADHFGFLGWKPHEPALWDRILAEAAGRDGRRRTNPLTVAGYDADAQAIRVARRNARSAGLEGRVRFEKREIASWAFGTPHERDRVEAPRGLVVTNPPYGKRLGEVGGLGGLYRQLREALERGFPGWRVSVLSGNRELEHLLQTRGWTRLGPVRTVFNGPIECRFLSFGLPSEPARPTAAPSRRAGRGEDQSDELTNRLRKRFKHLRRWASRRDITCYRVYDADVPSYRVAIDLYEEYAHVQEYEAPRHVDAEAAEERLTHVLRVVPDVLGVEPEHVYLKRRRRQRGKAQYEKLGESGQLTEVREAGLKFWINLQDYLDTGLFLDKRLVRAMIGERARGRRFLNLFGYTGTASVYAARGGAAETITVDLSNTYLDWARKNFELNDIAGPAHRFVRADCLEWLERETGRYGLIFVDPPSFSTSKAMSRTFDVQRDHLALLRAAARLLEPGGELIFCTNRKRFQLAPELVSERVCEDLSDQTLPEDFARSRNRHWTSRIVNRET